jgi:uncharacterized protein
MDRQRLLQLLISQHEWPGPYTFKFIVLEEDEDRLDAILTGFQTTKKQSSTGKYVSFTSKKWFLKADEVMDVYDQAGQIPRLIAL